MIITDTHVYFYGGTFSNWVCDHPISVECNDGIFREFQTSEHAFMYIKAETFNQPDLARLILNSGNPAYAKQLGRDIPNFDAKLWAEVSYEAMYRACLAKFTQWEDGKQDMLLCDGKIFVEASPYDRIWGIGLGLDDNRIYDETKWKGTNLLGKVLNQVLDEIK